MRQEISGFLAYIGSERGFSPKTIEAYRHDLGKFSEFADAEMGESWQWDGVDQYTIKAYLQSLADRGNAAVSRGRKLATLKSFFKYLTSQGRVKTDPTATIKMPKVQQKEPSYLTEQEYKRLLRTVQKNATKFFRARDTAIVTMFLGMGLRLSELVELDIGNINFDDGTIKVTRKGKPVKR